MKRFIIFVFIISIYFGLYGQSYSFFNIQPDVGGNDMQGVCRAIILHDSTFSIIGHRLDTTGPGSDVKPWLGEFNYHGELTFLSPLIDSQYEEPFYPDQILYAHKSGDMYYAYVARFLGGSYSTPYLFEFNIRTGKIIRSKLIPNQKYPGIENWMSNIIVAGEKIKLLSYVYRQDSVKMFITELDSLFNITRFIEIKNITRRQYPYYFEQNTDSTFTIIEIAFLPNDHGDIKLNYFYIHLDESGRVLDGKIAPTSVPIGTGLTLARGIQKNKNNQWIITGQDYHLEPDSCSQCAVWIPYIFSVTANFDSLLWETRFFDIPYRVGPYYDVYSLTTVEDGYIATADFFASDIDKFPYSGVLFKAGINGDSLWMKHYIPLEWDESRVLWATLESISTTPFGSIIAAGEVADGGLRIIRPWILHLDKDGCLVPGCNLVNAQEEVALDGKKEYFKIYPNPASSDLYLLSTITSYDPVNIRLVSNDGVVLKSREFTPVAGYQYTLPVGDLPSGLYYLILTDKKNQQSESHTFVIE